MIEVIEASGRGARGVRLLRVDGRDVWMSWEDVALVIMGPRSNKTSALAVPAVLSAPGLVVATSNKADLWALTAGLRGRAGPVWTFDPQAIAHAPQTLVVGPAAGDPRRRPDRPPVRRRRPAGRALHGHHRRHRKDPFFHAAGEQVLTGTLLAAAVSGGTMREVVGWLQHGRRDAITALDRAGARRRSRRPGSHPRRRRRHHQRHLPDRPHRHQSPHLRADPALDHPTRHLAHPTRPTAAADRLAVTNSTPWQPASPTPPARPRRPCTCCPRKAPAPPPRWSPPWSTGSSRSPNSPPRPAAAASTHPLVAVLDEAANICPIPTLPQLYSHYGSRGIQVLTMLQSYQQGVGVWGTQGMDALWSAATVKLVGAGVDDHAFLHRLSGLIGDHDVEKISTSHGRGHGPGRQYSTTREPVLPASTLRALPRTHAVLLATGRRAGLGELLPWYRERPTPPTSPH